MLIPQTQAGTSPPHTVRSPAAGREFYTADYTLCVRSCLKVHTDLTTKRRHENKGSCTVALPIKPKPDPGATPAAESSPARPGARGPAAVAAQRALQGVLLLLGPSAGAARCRDSRLLTTDPEPAPAAAQPSARNQGWARLPLPRGTPETYEPAKSPLNKASERAAPRGASRAEPYEKESHPTRGKGYCRFSYRVIRSL